MTERTEEIHPHEIIAKYVRRYEETIRPALEAGNFAKARVAIFESRLEWANLMEIMARRLLQIRNGASEPYVSSLASLGCYAEHGEGYELSRSQTLLETKAHIARLKFVMAGDADYERFRKPAVERN